MRILIFGAGGVGSVLGAFLARMGHDVSLVGRAAHMDAIRKNGLAVSGIWGSFRTKAFELYRGAAEVPKDEAPFELIFLTVKSFDTASAVEEAARFMNENSVLVSFQNGLGNSETILEKITPQQYLAGRVIFGVQLEPGAVEVTVTADAVALGAWPGAEPKHSAKEVAALLNDAGIAARAVDDIRSVIWAKVIYNCALNGICTLHEMPYGNILKNEDTRAWMRDIVRECYAVAGAKKVTLDPPSTDKYIEWLFGTLIPRTAAHFPSMLQDLKKKKKTDIDALNGAIARYAQAENISVPLNARITEAIHAKSKGQIISSDLQFLK